MWMDLLWKVDEVKRCHFIQDHLTFSYYCWREGLASFNSTWVFSFWVRSESWEQMCSEEKLCCAFQGVMYYLLVGIKTSIFLHRGKRLCFPRKLKVILIVVYRRLHSCILPVDSQYIDLRCIVLYFTHCMLFCFFNYTNLKDRNWACYIFTWQSFSQKITTESISFDLSSIYMWNDHSKRPFHLKGIQCCICEAQQIPQYYLLLHIDQPSSR